MWTCRYGVSIHLVPSCPKQEVQNSGLHRIIILMSCGKTKLHVSEDFEMKYFSFSKVPGLLPLALQLVKKHCLVIYWLICTAFSNLVTAHIIRQFQFSERLIFMECLRGTRVKRFYSRTTEGDCIQVRFKSQIRYLLLLIISFFFFSYQHFSILLK